MYRRTFLTTAVASLITYRVGASEFFAAEIDLWPNLLPSQDREKTNRNGTISHVSRPRLRLYKPANPNGTAILVIAGGGYARISAGMESTPACRWLQSLGITAFELIYRVPEDGFGAHAPFEDAQRGMRLLRADARTYGVDAQRIGIMGFSAGGHLAGMTAVRPGWALYTPRDVADGVSARPDFTALLYPVITLMPPFDHTRTRKELIGAHPSERQSAGYSVEKFVDAHSPPTFLAQAEDDPISPVENSKLMSRALQAVGVESELHLFQTGGHGWGLGHKGSEPAVWPSLFLAWAKANGFISA